MSTEYTKTNWQDGDIITADKMNNIENGIKGIEEATTHVKDDFDNELFDKVPKQGSFPFSGGASALSTIKLSAGVTYTIKNTTSGVYGGLLYIDGHSSPSKTMPTKDNTVEFTPSDTGFLKYYDGAVASGTTVTFTVIGTDVYDKEAIIPKVQDDIYDLQTALQNMDAPTIYTVGSGKQYESFVDCINALPESGSKIVYVYAGEYDIYDEMGGDDFVTSMSASSAWYNVNPIIQSNTKVIGIGRVVFKYNCPDGIDSSKAVLLSCLNIRGSVTIENINIECKNLRYAVHVEGSANSMFNNSKYVIKNCNMIRNDGTYENAAIGIGLNYGCEIQIDGCQIESKTTHGNSLLIHGNSESLAGSVKMSILNTIMIDNYMTLQLMCRANSVAVIPVNIINSYLKTLIYKTTASGQQCSDEFSVTLVNCNNVPVNNGSSIINLRDVNRYNVI